MRRYLFLLALLLTITACHSWPSGSVCNCQGKLEKIPTSPGDPTFVSARKNRMACFLRARSVALSGKATACDVQLEADIKSDISDLIAKKKELEDLKGAARTAEQVKFVEEQITEIKKALDDEQMYLPPAKDEAKAESTEEDKAESCECAIPMSHIERDLTLVPDDMRFLRGVKDLSYCLKSLRHIALNHFRDKTTECHPEPCDTRIDSLETLIVTETKSLVAQRDSVAKELAARNRHDEDDLIGQLYNIKTAIDILEPYVTIAGTDVTVRQGDFQERRKAHEATHSAAMQEKTCVDRYAYLDVPTEPDPKGLIDCVDTMRRLCRTAPIDKKSCDVIVAAPIDQCELGLSRLEQKLREYAGSQVDQLNKLKAAHDALNSDDKKTNDDEQKAISIRLADIRKREVIPDEGDVTEYSDYKQWWSKFSMGFEYVSLNHALTKGFPRLGATIGLNLPRQAVPDVSLRNWHPKSYGLFTTFAVGLTNTAEETSTAIPGVTAAALTKKATSPPEAKNALAVEEQIFWPWWRSDLDPMDRRLRTWFGAVVAGGGHKTDTDNFIATRLYYGFRFARSPEMYADWMYGRSSELHSGRLEVRGQFPIYRFQNRSRLVLGGIGNFGVDQRKRHGDCAPASSTSLLQPTDCAELDSIRFYLTYDVNADSLMKIFGGGK